MKHPQFRRGQPADNQYVRRTRVLSIKVNLILSMILCGITGYLFVIYILFLFHS